MEDAATATTRVQQIKFKMTRAPWGRWIVRPWSAHLPTMYFLDINAMDVIKKVANAQPLDARKQALVARLRSIDLPGNRVSCLIALMEKVNDRKSNLPDALLRQEIENDVALMRAFFHHAKPGDPDTFHLDYFDGFRGGLLEHGEPEYVQFLRAVNDQHELAQTVSPKKRFKKTEGVIATADALGIRRTHPVVVLSLACLYGNPDARKVLKFKEDPRAFRVENVLADVMAIGRFLERKIELEQMGHRGQSSIQTAEYITDDTGLAAVLKSYRGTSVSYADLGDRQEIRTIGTMDFADLLTEIGPSLGPSSDQSDPTSAVPSEYMRVCDLLLREPPGSTKNDTSSAAT